MTLVGFNDLLTEAVTRPALMKPWLGKVHCGDVVEMLGKMPVGSIDLIVTSPPYGKTVLAIGLKNGSGGKWPNAALMDGYTDHDDAMPHDKYVKWQRDCLSAMLRVLREDGAIFSITSGAYRVELAPISLTAFPSDHCLEAGWRD